jgi:hypothetical protein
MAAAQNTIDDLEKRRLAEAVMALAHDLCGIGPLGQDRQALSREHEAAFRDYVDERGR